MSSKKQQPPKRSIPEFKNREEAAEWYDTHDLADYWDELKPVEVRFSENLSELLTIRFDKDSLHKLQQEADQKGVDPATLARTWIMERLRSG